MTIFNTTSKEGVDVNQVFIYDTGTPEYPGIPFNLGELCWGTDGSEWVYGTASITIAAGSVVRFSETAGSWSVALIGGATIATAPTGDLLGIVGGATGSVAIPAPTGTQKGTYFWVQRAGNVPNVKCISTTTKNAQLYSSATTGGYVNSAAGGASTTYQVNGLVISIANGSSANTNTAIANYPVVGTSA